MPEESLHHSASLPSRPAIWWSSILLDGPYFCGLPIGSDHSTIMTEMRGSSIGQIAASICYVSFYQKYILLYKYLVYFISYSLLQFNFLKLSIFINIIVVFILRSLFIKYLKFAARSFRVAWAAFCLLLSKITYVCLDINAKDGYLLFGWQLISK